MSDTTWTWLRVWYADKPTPYYRDIKVTNLSGTRDDEVIYAEARRLVSEEFNRTWPGGSDPEDFIVRVLPEDE